MTITKTQILTADQPYENPYRRLQWPQLFAPDHFGFDDKWVMMYQRPYFTETSNDNLLWTTDIAIADNPEGPWEKVEKDIFKNCEAFSAYWDAHVKRLRYTSIVGGWGQTETPFEYLNNNSWGSEYGPTCIEKCIPLNSQNGFLMMGRKSQNVGSKDWRRVGMWESGNFSSWNDFAVSQFDGSEFEQPYGMMIMDYGSYLIGVVQWITLDQTPSSNNSTGECWNELVYMQPDGSWSSMNGKTWTRTNTSILGKGASGTFDAGGALAGKPVIHDGMFYLPYTAFKYKHNTSDGSTLGRPPADAMSIGLLSMTQSEFDALLV